MRCVPSTSLPLSRIALHLLIDLLLPCESPVLVEVCHPVFVLTSTESWVLLSESMIVVDEVPIDLLFNAHVPNHGHLLSDSAPAG